MAFWKKFRKKYAYFLREFWQKLYLLLIFSSKCRNFTDLKYKNFAESIIKNFGSNSEIWGGGAPPCPRPIGNAAQLWTF
jgi:hypothetical protein